MMLVDVNGVQVQVLRRDVKSLRLRVRESDGQVVATAPLGMPRADVEGFLNAHAAWIAGHREAAMRSPMHRAEYADAAEVAQWRALVQAGTELLVDKWAPVLGVRPRKLAYRNMRSRWGSCTPDTGRVCINVRLALYPPRCLEYVVVHELCHFHVRNHGPEFKALMDECLPNWRQTKKILDGRA